MEEIKYPNYVHYSRMNTINAREAQWLLASFDLRNNDTSDPDQYESLLNTEMKLAYKVLSDVLANDILKYTCNGNPIIYDNYGTEHYDLDCVFLNMAEFCTWAINSKYKLPEELAELANPNSRQIVSEQDDNGSNLEKAPITQEKENTGGKPKGYLSEAVEHVYNEILKQEKHGLLKPSKIREFIIYMKEKATKSSRHADDYVMDRIKSIQIPEEGACTIITEDNVIIRGQNETIVRGKSYAINDIAKILTRLRKNNLIPM